MVERSAPWPGGTPTWVDLAADDAEAAAVFYAGLFGWDCEHQGDQNYWVCKLAGRDIGGIGPKQPGTEALPSRWTTYLATADIERTVAAIGAYGGRVLLAPTDIGVHGRMAITADPNGAIFGLWQAGEHIGTARRAEPGSLVWNETLSRDHEAAKTFYSAVFGYPVEELGPHSAFGNAGDQYAHARYAAFYVAGRPVAGAGEFHPDMPAGTTPHWLPYFATADTGQTVDQALRTGGTLVGRPLETDFGRMAVLEDPESAVFAVIQLDPA